VNKRYPGKEGEVYSPDGGIDDLSILVRISEIVGLAGIRRAKGLDGIVLFFVGRG